VNGKVDSSATLDAFTEWIQDQTNLPQFDHAMGFTGLVLNKINSFKGSFSLKLLYFTSTRKQVFSFDIYYDPRLLHGLKVTLALHAD
jgi:hypothetical protein